jgi:outer membrane protein assembly factor BamB
MIPEGLPGAGNILIFDNGSDRKFTRVIEINPITKKTIWSYSDPGNFFNPYAGSQKRLKNSDTYISDDESSKAFIVDKKGRIKWRYKDSNSTRSVKRPTIYPRKDFAHCLSKESK